MSHSPPTGPLTEARGPPRGSHRHPPEQPIRNVSLGHANRRSADQVPHMPSRTSPLSAAEMPRKAQSTI